MHIDEKYRNNRVESDHAALKSTAWLSVKLQISEVRESDVAKNGNHQNDQERTHSKQTIRCPRRNRIRTPTV